MREELISAELEIHLSEIELTKQEVDTLRAKFHDWLKQFDQAQIIHQAKSRLTKLEDRLSRLTDKFVDDLIDQSVYESKRSDIANEIAECRSRMAREDKSGWYLQKLEELLEQAKTLVSAYEIADLDRKREIVTFASSNRTVNGKQIAIAPPNWRRTPAAPESVLQCAHYRDTTRTFEAIKHVILQPAS